jgi:prophage regulatory protein
MAKRSLAAVDAAIRVRVAKLGVEIPQNLTQADVLALLKTGREESASAKRLLAHGRAAESATRRDQLIGVQEVMKRTDLSRTTLWRLERAGDFPKRVPLSKNRVAWKESQVNAWIAQRRSR